MKEKKVTGLKDGLRTAHTALLTRSVRAVGATVSIAQTGRVTLTTATGERRVYVLDMCNVCRTSEHQCKGHTSPLTAALADLQTA